MRCLVGSIPHIAGGTSDYEDSRRLASGLSAGLSRNRLPGDGIRQREENFHERVIEPLHEIHQQDPHNTRGSCPSNPGMGLEQCHLWPREAEEDTVRIVTWLRPVIPKRLMMLLSGTDNRRNLWNYTARHCTWLWAKLLQEEYPSEGYSMNTRSTPREVEALQNRAHEYMRQQVEQMDDWERALHREWVSLISRNAISFPYPMEGNLEDGATTSESIQTTPAFQDWNPNANPRGSVLTRNRSRKQTRSAMTGGLFPEVNRTSSSSEGISHVSWNPISVPYRREGTLEDGTTTSGSTQTTTASKGYGVTKR